LAEIAGLFAADAAVRRPARRDPAHFVYALAAHREAGRCTEAAAEDSATTTDAAPAADAPTPAPAAARRRITQTPPTPRQTPPVTTHRRQPPSNARVGGSDALDEA
jgi:hypothetical protein